MFCNFSSVVQILYDGVDKSYDPLYPDQPASQVAFLTALFCNYTDAQNVNFETATASRYFKNSRTLSRPILAYYKRKFADLEYDVTTYITPWLGDMQDTAQALYDLVHDDTHMKSDQKYELLSCSEQLEYFIAKVVHYAMFQPLQPKQKYLPKVSDYQLYFHHLKNDHKPPKPCPYFCGRDTELAALHDALQTYKQVFVHGIAGIGKSEFTKAYAEIHAEDYENILYLTYRDDLEMTIALLEVTGKPKQIAFNEHYKKLQSLDDKSLIILDNFDTTPAKEKLLGKLLKLNCRLLITTRCKFEQAYTLELSEIADTEILLGLAGKYFEKTTDYRDYVTEIIEIVHHHTYAVELAARLLQTGLFKPDAVLQKLRDSAINPTLTDEISTEKDNLYQRHDYYNHIHLLFSLFELSDPMQYVLRCAYFLPLNGLDARQFAEWLELQDLNAVHDLDEIGLLKLSQENSLSMHPMVHDIVSADLSPSIENCNTFCKHLYDICKAHGLAKPNQPFADILLSVFRQVHYEDLDGYLLFLEEGVCYFEQTEMFNELKSLVAFYETVFQTLPEKDDKHLAKLYWVQLTGVGVARKKYAAAIPLAKNALALADACSLEFEANMHHNLGWLYLHLKKLQAAKTEFESALAIYDRLETTNHDTIQTLKLLEAVNIALSRKRK